MDKLNLSNIAIGDILFFRDDSLLSKAIRLVETGKFNQDVPSHVSIVEIILDNDIGTIEASFTVRRAKLSDRKNAHVWAANIVGSKDIDKGLDYVRAKLGEGYDYGALAGIALRCFWRLFGPWVYDHSKKIQNFLQSKTRFFCSELGFDYTLEATGKAPCQSSPSETTPYDLFRSKLLSVYERT